MGSARRVLAAALCLASVGQALGAFSWGNDKINQLQEEVTSFMVLGDWGGQATPPYTTPGQLSAASAMAKVATESAATFVVSPGGNFYGGLPGAAPSLKLWARPYRMRWPLPLPPGSFASAG